MRAASAEVAGWAGMRAGAEEEEEERSAAMGAGGGVAMLVVAWEVVGLVAAKRAAVAGGVAVGQVEEAKRAAARKAAVVPAAVAVKAEAVGEQVAAAEVASAAAAGAAVTASAEAATAAVPVRVGAKVAFLAVVVAHIQSLHMLAKVERAAQGEWLSRCSLAAARSHLPRRRSRQDRERRLGRRGPPPARASRVYFP